MIQVTAVSLYSEWWWSGRWHPLGLERWWWSCSHLRCGSESEDISATIKLSLSSSDHLIVSTWRAPGLSLMMSAACFRALLALCSPSAAITLARASLAASASAAMALWSLSGTLTSFTSTLSTYASTNHRLAVKTSQISIFNQWLENIYTKTPHGSVHASNVSFISMAIESLQYFNAFFVKILLFTSQIIFLPSSLFQECSGAWRRPVIVLKC